MQTDEFVRRVQEQTHLSMGDDALRVVRATLATLGERLSRDERRELAAQLPTQLKEYVLEYGETSRFRLEEFYNRVAARAELSPPDAVEHTRTVLAILQEAVSDGQIEDIRDELPNEFEALFSGQRPGPASSAG